MNTQDFSPQGKDPETGEHAWHAADFDALEHTLETTDAWTPPPADRPIVFGRHAQRPEGLDTTVVVTDIGTPDDLRSRTDAAAADSPEVHLLFTGIPGHGKTRSAALAAAASRIHHNLAS
ncbi:hypothetical protein ACWCPS_35990 [Streptomyces mauvecolor]